MNLPLPYIPAELCAHTVLIDMRRSHRGRWRCTVCVECGTTLRGRPPNVELRETVRTDFGARVEQAAIEDAIRDLARLVTTIGGPAPSP